MTNNLFYKFIKLITVLLVFSGQQNLSVADDLVLPDLNGKQIKVSDYKGKWVIVNYWATWCPPCAEEIPELNAFHKKHHAKTAVVIGVNIETDDIGYVKEFAKSFKIIYPVLQAQVEDTVSSPYGHLSALPTTFILNREGKVQQTIVGGVTSRQLEKIICTSEKTSC